MAAFETKETDRKNKFRFKAVKVALTYSQWRKEKMSKDDFRSWVLTHFCGLDVKPMVTEWMFSQELHKDGMVHVHGYLRFCDKMETRDCRHFDRDGVHPNIRKVQNVRGWLKYISKDGDWISSGIEPPKEEKKVWYNYRKDQSDKKAYEEDKARSEYKEIEWPLKLKWCEIPKPDARNKKRHWWIRGDPTKHSKTYEIDQATIGMKVFFAGLQETYRFEDYRDEELIVYNDVIPKVPELISVTDTLSRPMERPGGSRFVKGYWPANKPRTVIVLSNVLPPHDRTAAFDARFNVIDLDQ